MQNLTIVVDLPVGIEETPGSFLLFVVITGWIGDDDDDVIFL